MKRYYILVVFLFMVNTALSQISHSFAFQTADFTLRTDNENYTHIEIPSFDGFTAQEGAPELPVVIKKFLLPMGSTITGINISHTGEVLLNGNANIYPAQPVVAFDSIMPDYIGI